VPLTDCAGQELRKSEVDLFLCREANKRPPFREEVASSLRPARCAGEAWLQRLGWEVEHGGSSWNRQIGICIRRCAWTKELQENDTIFLVKCMQEWIDRDCEPIALI
jgi:hypothetical protein